MNRPKQHQLQTNAHPEETLGVRAEDVLPEHMLLRFLSNCGIVENDKPVDTDFAMRVAAMIAASESFEGPSGQVGNEAGPSAEEPMTDERDPSSENTQPLDTVQLEEAAAIAAEATTELAVSGEPLPEQPPEVPQADGTSDEEVTADVGELIADTATDATAEAGESSGAETAKQAAISQEEEELGALMADVTEVASAEEQAQLEAAFAEDAVEQETPAGEATADTPATDEDATAESVAQEPEEAEEPAAVAEASTAEEPAQDEEPVAVAEEPAADAVVDEAPAAVEPTVDDADAEQALAAEQVDEAVTDEAVTQEAAIADEPAVELTPQPEPEANEAPTAAADDSGAALKQDPAGEEFALTNGTMDKVQDFLSELKGALVQMAQRPPESAPAPEPAAPLDVEPLMNAMQQGFEKSAQQAEQANSAVASLSEHMAQLGNQLEGGMSKVAGSLASQPLANPNTTGTTTSPDFVADRSASQAIVLGAVCLIVLGWSIIFWIKTGSPKLALGTLIGANVIACCLLLSRGTRS